MVIKEYLAVKVAELRQAQDIVVRASQAGTFPDLKQVPESVLQTIQGTLLLLGLSLVLLLSRRSRKLALDTAETLVATSLLILIIAIILGLPVGIIYLSYRGLHYLVFATLQLPWVQALLNGIL